jgi:NADPH2:quinone reductase
LIGQRVVVRELAETPTDGIDRLELVPQERPVPGPGEVVVAVRSAQVNWVDLLMTSGQYQHVPPLPYTPGLEYAGVVELVGDGVTGIAPGDRVLSDGFVTGPRSPGAYQRDGGFATWARAPAAGVRPIPAALGFDEACNLLANYETAWHALIGCGGLRAGETVLILGASGATGLAAVHVAKQVGATVIAAGRSADKLAIVKAQGADHVVQGPLRDAVKALTGGRGADVVYDGVGGDVSAEALRCVAFGARFLIVGWASTPSVAKGKGGRGTPDVNRLPTNLILIKGVRVLGCPTVIATQHDPSIRAARLAQVLGWAADGRIRPVIAAGYPLGEFRAAMLAKWEGAAVGGIVVRPC